MNHSPDDDRRIEEALALWREDTRRVAERLDTGLLTNRVLAADEDEGAPPDLQAGRRYAAAALLLLGLGTVGAALVPAPRPSATEQAHETTHLLEAERLDLLAERELLGLRTLRGD